MADLQNILDHPKKQEIIDQLVSGTSPKEVSTHLKLKYPGEDQKHLRLSATLLQAFLDKYLNASEEFKKDLTALKKKDEEYKKNLSPALANNATYQQRAAEVANTELDIIKFAMEILITAKARLEQVFDKIQEDPSKISPKQEYVIIRWYEVVASLIERYHKLVDPGTEQVTNYNITMQMVDEQVFAMQEAVRRVLLQMSLEDSNKYIELFNVELQRLKPPKPEEEPTQEERMVEVKMLQTQVKEKIDNEE